MRARDLWASVAGEKEKRSERKCPIPATLTREREWA